MQTRRSFLQSVAAALSVAVVGVKPNLSAIERPVIDYSLFADNDGDVFRYDVRSPFNIDGSIYATDCRIIVSHPGEWTGEEKARVPNIGSLQWSEFDSPGWSSLGTPKLTESQDAGTCAVCRGRGVLPVKPSSLSECDECQGSGTYYPPSFDITGISRPCPKCVSGYRGGVKCSACNSGYVDFLERVGNWDFNPKYMASVRSLGAVDVRVIDAETFLEHPYGMLLFRGAGDVRGMLVSMSKNA